MERHPILQIRTLSAKKVVFLAQGCRASKQLGWDLGLELIGPGLFRGLHMTPD